jgi:hypothetical protein
MLGRDMKIGIRTALLLERSLETEVVKVPRELLLFEDPLQGTIWGMLRMRGVEWWALYSQISRVAATQHLASALLLGLHNSRLEFCLHRCDNTKISIFFVDAPN